MKHNLKDFIHKLETKGALMNPLTYCRYWKEELEQLKLKFMANRQYYQSDLIDEILGENNK